MKTLMIFAMISFNVLADDFTYDNSINVIYEEEDNTISKSFSDQYMFKIPGTDCVVSRETHIYDKKTKEDTFKRTVACFNSESETVFRCSYDPNWKDSDGEPDETVTQCTQKIGKVTVTMNIRRYPTGKYKFKNMQKQFIESKKTI